jgi:branched-chain amino acid transport system ATP-binding protein
MSLLELRAVSKSFGGLTAVRDVSLCLAEKEVRAIIGPNGAGKSTLFNIIAGTFPPSAGDIIFNDASLAGRSSYEICQLGISRTFQITSIYRDLTAHENVRLAAQAKDPRRARMLGAHAVFSDAAARAEVALEQLGLTAGANRTAGLLSHGDQRLLELAMAVAQSPRVLLLDEPTQGLSVEETAQTVETLANLLYRQSVAVLLVEHDMEVVFRLAHAITVMHRGAVLAEGPPEVVRADKEVQRAYLGEAG